jgi:hypothetical protein
MLRGGGQRAQNNEAWLASHNSSEKRGMWRVRSAASGERKAPETEAGEQRYPSIPNSDGCDGDRYQVSRWMLETSQHLRVQRVIYFRRMRRRGLQLMIAEAFPVVCC